MEKNILSEQQLLGKAIDEVEHYFQCEAVHLRKGEYVIILKKYCLGIFQKRLHLFTCRNFVYDCYFRIDLR